MKKNILKVLNIIESYSAYFVLLMLTLFPTLEIIARKFFQTGIPDSSNYIKHLVLWITFIGGMITSKEKKHLALTASIDAIKEPLKSRINLTTGLISSIICFALSWSALAMVFIAFEPTGKVGIFPIRFITIIMPVGYFIMAVRFLTLLENTKSKYIVLFFGLFIGTFISLSSMGNLLLFFSIELPELLNSLMDTSILTVTALSKPLILILILSAFFGAPIFIVLGGITYVLFTASAGSLETIPNEAYTMLIDNSIPAIPLFTFAGFILSESKSGERLVNLFRSFFGWMPGGMAIMAILVCTFFTTFTGASGVTILALGGLLAYILTNSKYNESFTNGLITASGSIGMLFPPSLPIILYGVVAQVSIKKMFVGGLIPGFLMVSTLSVYAVVVALKNDIERVPFDYKNLFPAIRESLWDILLPFIILLGFFGGLFTIVETGAIAVVYSLFISLILHRDISLKQLPEVMMKCLPIIGGVLIILAISRGLSYFIVDAEIPMNLSAWVKTHIQSKILFLVILNIVLLITGCFMDIFSAIMVVVPLILPLGKIYGVDPVHLGIIFLANLGLGYLTPPVGLNLFLASYRFDKPLSEIYRCVIPFFIMLMIAVLLITYIPWLSTGLLGVIDF